MLAETRAVLDLDFVSFGDLVHMKNINGGFGQISLRNLMNSRLVIQDKNSCVLFTFKSVDELIAAGWAVD